MEDEKYIPEKQLANLPKSIPLQILKILVEKSEKQICKVYCNNGACGTGFFCNIIDG
jgi:hypothetical protein